MEFHNNAWKSTFSIDVMSARYVSHVKYLTCPKSKKLKRQTIYLESSLKELMIT